ncbi:MAG: hypothetical protein AAGG68_26825 [Bacteroidota bacterium]
MTIQKINVYELEELSYLTTVRCADFSEAAAVCLDHNCHNQEATLSVSGDLQAEFNLMWKEVNQQMRDSREDMQDSVESGAYCLAMLVIEKLTKLKVFKQSQKGTGFDFWLSDESIDGFEASARLEVSGILKGSMSQIENRLKEKVEQTRRSDTMELPAYVVVVEFSHPHLKIVKR